MELVEFLTIQNLIATTGAIGGLTGLFFGYRERKLANRSKRLTNIEKLEQFLDDDITQLHKVNDGLKWRLAIEREHTDEVEQENAVLRHEIKELKKKELKS